VLLPGVGDKITASRTDGRQDRATPLPGNFPEFHNVYVEPERAGKFPEGTIFFTSCS
jgi:hypothetical protein